MTLKLDPKIKERWVTALRSSRYRQGMRALCSRTGSQESFCCLGVLCELYIEDHPQLKELVGEASYTTHTRRIYQDSLGGESGAMLTNAIKAWALGLNEVSYIDHVAGDFMLPKTKQWLSALNDGGYSFHTIADKIEEEL